MERYCVPVWNTRPCRRTVSTSRRLSRIVTDTGFSQYTSLPASAARIEMGVCQWSGVAITTASTSGRASTSRKSLHAAQPR